MTKKRFQLECHRLFDDLKGADHYSIADVFLPPCSIQEHDPKLGELITAQQKATDDVYEYLRTKLEVKDG